MTSTRVDEFANVKVLQAHEREVATRVSTHRAGPRFADANRSTRDLTFLKYSIATREGQVTGNRDYSGPEKAEIAKRLFEDPDIDRTAAAKALRVSSSSSHDSTDRAVPDLLN